MTYAYLGEPVLSRSVVESLGEELAPVDDDLADGNSDEDI